MPAHLFFSLNFIMVAGHTWADPLAARTRAAGNSCTLGGYHHRGPRISRSVARANKFLELGSTRSKSERKPPVHAAARFLHATSTRFNWPSTRLERSLLSFPPFCPFSFFPPASFPPATEFLSRLSWHLMMYDTRDKLSKNNDGGGNLCFVEFTTNNE